MNIDSMNIYVQSRTFFIIFSPVGGDNFTLSNFTELLPRMYTELIKYKYLQENLKHDYKYLSNNL